MFVRPDTPVREPERPGGDDEGPVGALQCRAQRHDGTPSVLRGGLVLGEVVDEASGSPVAARRRRVAVESSSAPRCTAAPTTESAAAARLSGQAEHLMAGADQLGHEGAADEADAR